MFKQSIVAMIGIGSLVAAAGATAGGPMATAAGYDNCQSRIKQDHARVVFKRHYYLQRNEDSMTFLINASGWEGGERVHLRSACETTRSGRRVLALETHQGRWTTNPQGKVTIDVAQN